MEEFSCYCYASVGTSCSVNYRKRRNFRWGLIFMGKLPHENLYTQRISNNNYGGLLLLTKINPLKNFTHKILWPQNFVRLRYDPKLCGLDTVLYIKLFKGVITWLKNCYHNNVVHGDIKCDSCLLDKEGTLKLTSFGFASPQYSRRIKQFCRMYSHSAPKKLAQKPYDGFAMNIWSTGSCSIPQCTVPRLLKERSMKWWKSKCPRGPPLPPNLRYPRAAKTSSKKFYPIIPVKG